MKVDHAGGERPYSVDVQGERITVQDTMVAGFAYKTQLESRLGSPAHVVQCFKAWTRLQREGPENTPPQDLAHATAWMEAHRQARRQARKFLTAPNTKTFVLRLRDPHAGETRRAESKK